MVNTRIYFDIDGVINAGDGKRLRGKTRDSQYKYLESFTGWANWFNIKVDGFWITVSTDLIESISGLGSLDNVECVWLTSWQHSAAYSFSPSVRLPEGLTWRTLAGEMTSTIWTAHGSHTFYDPTWKVNSIYEDLKGFEGRVVWVDDDLTLMRPSAKVVTLEESYGDDLLFVKPIQQIGLTKPQMCGIIDFVTTE